MKDPKKEPDKPVEIPVIRMESDRYLEGYVNGIYDAACVGSVIALVMVGVYWYGMSKA